VPAGATAVVDEAGFRAAWTNAAETQIDLTADITLTCGGGGVAVRTSPVALNVDGHGHSITQTCANQGVLAQTGLGAVSFANVTVTGGASPALGGGVFAQGDLSWTSSTVISNTAGGDGGGFYSGGAVALTDAVVSHNTSNDGGGGFWVEGALTVTNSTVSANVDNGTLGGGGFRANSGTAAATMTNSTIDGNSAGGGGMAATGPTTITNSTITGNNAGGFGGGGIAISNVGQTTLVYATVVDNTAPVAANVQGVGGAQFAGFGSVVALPNGGPNCATPATITNGHNYSDDASCGFTDATDTQNGANPNLGPLAANGGPTHTRLPQAGSPLIDAMPLASCQSDGAAGITTDQRGLQRPSGNGCDIGSVEVQQTPQTKDDCKDDAWQRFVDDTGQPFKNQGQCVSFVNHQ
jgi:hypothetical protein